MKLKLTAIALLLATNSYAEVRYSQDAIPVTPPIIKNIVSHGNNVRYANVVSVEPIRHREAYSETRHLCSTNNVPIYDSVPIYQNREPSSHAPLIGMILGAAIGASVLKGDARILGGVAGATVGHSMGSTPSKNIVGYSTQISGYQQVQNCQTVHVPLERYAVIGYKVVYEDRNELMSVTMSRHPGSTIRIISQIE